MKRLLGLGCLLSSLVLLLVLGMVAGVVLDRRVFTRFIPPGNMPDGAEGQFRLLAEAWNVIEREYVDPRAADRQKLVYGAISGMVEALGDTGHTTFMTPAMVQESHQFATGQFNGIGVYLEMRDDQAVIVAPIDDSPADAAGLQPGDVILGVDGESTADMSLAQLSERIAGPAGTRVTLTILRPATAETLDVTLTCQPIEVRNVMWAPVPGTHLAHLRIVTFNAGTAQGVQQALAEIRQQGLTGIILDLRRNPGGLLNEAVGVTSQFLAGGNVLLQKDVRGHVREVPVEAGGLTTDLPLVVLIDAGTASGAEIVAGALQDARRATLVGETTFGTGTVLRPFPLSDGSLLLLATDQWLTPNGRVIWHKGIEPDVPVELPPGATPLLHAITEALTLEALDTTDDVQFLRALKEISRND